MNLILNVKGKYFKEIQSGEKEFEYRLVNKYWTSRLSYYLQDKDFDGIIIKLGYPKNGDRDKILERPWRGVEIIAITHPEFGEKPVKVFAIRVN